MAATLSPGIRPNPAGDRPRVDPSAYVDPSAQIIGHVLIGRRVFVGPQTVLRADEPDASGRVHPIVVEEDACLQDGVIVHARAGSEVRIGPRCNISHGAVIHGPAKIAADSFIALRAVVYQAEVGEGVWVGVGSIVMGSQIPAHVWIPAGSIIRSETDTRSFRLVDLKEEKHKKDIYDATAALREAYLKLPTE
ncbi:MAG: hypothetical protein WHT06_02430 [Desulfobacterales bacterium]